MVKWLLVVPCTISATVRAERCDSCAEGQRVRLWGCWTRGDCGLFGKAFFVLLLEDWPRLLMTAGILLMTCICVERR